MTTSIHKENLMHAVKMMSAAAVLALGLAPAAHAQTSSGEAVRLTILTFSQPVQLPGVTLPAGKYRFEMEDLNTTGHTVKVSREDGTNVGLFKTITATDNSRDLKSTDVAIMWSERSAGQPQALKEWYYPQRSNGEEFVYPRTEAVAIAAANHASVPTEQDGKIVRVDENGNVADESDSSASKSSGSSSSGSNTSASSPSSNSSASNSSGANSASNSSASNSSASNSSGSNASTPAAQTQVAQAPAASSVGTSGAAPRAPSSQAPAPARKTLPRTASQLALFELLSGLSLAAAFGVRQLRTRLAVRS